MKCHACGRSVRNVIGLIRIGHKHYCSRCLSKIRVKETGKKVKLYTNLGSRCFVEVWERGYTTVQEYNLQELKIG
ncbi:hypothetical protein CACET_c15480 [Clostridium aceticum]|uniref:Uncharacterized protein n=1 Tax=Clostridium aceticum TaxID=84022 RepID=A0A0D8IC75_9CLOT|nr:hypothetical protein CACET_c15480 [Clostridium aceticum]KJF27900.1 hypothetical protein TZ02_04800 [Clostridium aceticum]